MNMLGRFGQRMATPRDAASPPAPALILCNWAAMILAGLFNYLNAVPYSLTAVDTLISSALLVLGVAPLAWLQWHFPNRLIYALLTGIMVGLFVDLNDMPVLAAAMLVPGLAILAYVFPREAARLCAAIMGTVFVWQCITPWTRATVPDADWSVKASDRPALLHIILDSYTGPEGLALQGEMGAQARLSLKKLADDHGLWVAPRAFGRHPNTVNSLPEILSLAEFPAPAHPMRTNRLILPELPYLTGLGKLGYAVHVVQTDFIDLCRYNEVRSCRTVNRSDLSAMAAFGLPMVDRVQVILSNYLNFSALTAIAAGDLISISHWLGYSDERPLYLRAKLFSVTGAHELDRLASRISTIAPGNALIVHVLMPHDPYSFDENCALTPFSAWQYEETGPHWRKALAAYDRQLVCANRKIGKVIAQFRRSSGGRNGLVVIHGDHGSRIARDDVLFKPGARPSHDAVISHYSALFAVSAAPLKLSPAGEADSAQPRAVSGLLRALLNSDFTRLTPVGADEGRILLADENWQPRQAIGVAEPNVAVRNKAD